MSVAPRASCRCPGYEGCEHGHRPCLETPRGGFLCAHCRAAKEDAGQPGSLRDGAPEQRDPVEELRQRILAALAAYEAAKFEVGDEGGDSELGAGLRLIQNTLDTTDPVVQVVARELVGTEELAAYTDERARPVVQRILDGEFGCRGAFTPFEIEHDGAVESGGA